MNFVRELYKGTFSTGFEGFIDSICIKTCDSVPELCIRGWGRVNGNNIVRIECFDVSTDESVGLITDFKNRPDLPFDAISFDAIIKLNKRNSIRFFDYGILAEDNSGRRYPLFQHSPKNVQIELEGRCNLACVMCPQAFDVHSGSLNDSDLLMLKPVIDDSECIEINHQGEALLSPKLLDLLRLVPPHKQIAFNTNGTALKWKAAKLLLEYSPPVRFISISIDAGTEESFYKIRGTSLKQIMKNAIAFKNARDSLGLHFPKIAITCTVMNDFMDFIPDIINLAAQLDGEFKYWPLSGSGLHGGKSWVTPFKDHDRDFIYEEQIPRDGKAWKKMVSEIEARSKLLGVNLVHPFQYSWSFSSENEDIKPTSKGVSKCPLIHRQRFFNANGNAQICCVQTEPMFNWREFSPDRFDEHESVIKARQLA